MRKEEIDAKINAFKAKQDTIRLTRKSHQTNDRFNELQRAMKVKEEKRLKVINDSEVEKATLKELNRLRKEEVDENRKIIKNARLGIKAEIIHKHLFQL